MVSKILLDDNRRKDWSFDTAQVSAASGLRQRVTSQHLLRLPPQTWKQFIHPFYAPGNWPRSAKAAHRVREKYASRMFSPFASRLLAIKHPLVRVAAYASRCSRNEKR